MTYRLADSSGMTILTEDITMWKLSEFYQQNRLMPSRHKLYIMLVVGNVSFDMVMTCVLHSKWYIFFNRKAKLMKLQLK